MILAGCGKEQTKNRNDAGKSVTPPIKNAQVSLPTPAPVAPPTPVTITPQKEMKLDLGDGVTMELVLIPAGEFMMGSEHSAKETADWAGKWDDGLTADKLTQEHPQHKVKISQPFYMGKYEVTQEQYEKIMNTNPSYFKVEKNPVEQVSWEDTVEFCKKLSQKTGCEIRLSSEAEWEYACRAGSTTKLSFDDIEKELGDYAWYESNSSNIPHPVGQKKANAFGLYDMQGNVWEWCRDWYNGNYYQKSPAEDPVGPDTGIILVLRGGSYCDNPLECRAASRFMNNPKYRLLNTGFRVVCISVRKTP